MTCFFVHEDIQCNHCCFYHYSLVEYVPQKGTWHIFFKVSNCISPVLLSQFLKKKTILGEYISKNYWMNLKSQTIEDLKEVLHPTAVTLIFNKSISIIHIKCHFNMRHVD